MKSAANAINGSALIFVEVVVVSGMKIENERTRRKYVFPLVGLDVEVVLALTCTAKKLHDGQDSNLRGQRPMDFKSIPLTTPAPS